MLPVAIEKFFLFRSKGQGQTFRVWICCHSGYLSHEIFKYPRHVDLVRNIWFTFKRMILVITNNWMELFPLSNIATSRSNYGEVHFIVTHVTLVRCSIFRAQEPKAPVTYCDHALSVVCRPSVVRPLDYLHFHLLLQNRLMDFDETWYGWSTQGPLQVLLFFGQIRPGADPGRAKIGHGGSPSSKNFFFRTKGYSIKPNA